LHWGKRSSDTQSDLAAIECRGIPPRFAPTLSGRDALRDIDALLSQPPTSEARGTSLTRVDSMWRLAAQLSKATHDQTDIGLQRLEQSTSDAQQSLFWQSICLTVLTAGLAALFTMMWKGRSRRIEGAHPPVG
jgi:hypothetical protein